MTSSTAVRFTTAEFQLSHGKSPRGEGCWAFDFDAGPEFFPGCVTFSEAKAWAKGVAQERGVSLVKVCP